MKPKETNEIVVMGQKIQTRIEEVDISKLKYWKENPRVNAIIKQKYRNENISEEIIENELWMKDSVKDLYKDIERHGGLIDEILIRDNIVLEGNSRLCAYRHLYNKAEQKKDEDEMLKWSYLRARIIPNETSEEVVFSILGTWHIKGKTQWDTYEKAAYLKRMNVDYGKPIKDIADMISETEKFVKDHIEAHDLMVENDIYTLEKFSHFLQLVLEKNKTKNQMIFAKEPQIVQRVIESIKEDSIKRAEDLRDLSKILNDQKAKKRYLNKEVDFNDAMEITENRHPEHTESLFNHVKKTTQLLEKCSMQQIEEIKSNKDKTYLIKKLYKESGKICKKANIL